MLLILIFSILIFQPPDVDVLIAELSVNPQRAQVAQDELQGMGVKAFPSLLGYIDSKAKVALPRPEAVMSLDGKVPDFELGQFVFYFIRKQIEGGSQGKTGRQAFLLTPGNIVKWLESHKDLTLEQLRFVAISESIQRVAEEMEKEGVNESNIGAMSVLSRRLMDATRGWKPNNNK